MYMPHTQDMFDKHWIVVTWSYIAYVLQILNYYYHIIFGANIQLLLPDHICSSLTEPEIAFYNK